MGLKAKTKKTSINIFHALGDGVLFGDDEGDHYLHRGGYTFHIIGRTFYFIEYNSYRNCMRQLLQLGILGSRIGNRVVTGNRNARYRYDTFRFQLFI